MIELCGSEFIIEGKFVRIAQLHGDGYRFIDDPARVVNALSECKERIDLLAFTQRLGDNRPRFSYHMETENLAVLPVTTFENWWTQQIGFKARNKAKQAEKKGVVIREVPFDDKLVAGIWEIYNESPIRQRRRYPHYGKDLETVRREEATFLDSSIFIGAFFEEKLIGFIKLVPDETLTQAGLMNIVSMIKHLDKAPQNALIACAVRACANRGIRYLVYSNFDYGKKQQDSLRDFKERNAFQRVETPRYFVPVTTLGRVAFRLGLHHRLREHMPELLAARLRDLRAAWYERKYRSAMGEL